MYVYIYVRKVQPKVIYYTTELCHPYFIPGLGTKKPTWQTCLDIPKVTTHVSVKIPVKFSKRCGSYLRNSVAVKLKLLFRSKHFEIIL